VSNDVAQTVLIVGATSDIARAIAREYARLGLRLQLAARNGENLHADAEDLSLRHGASVSVHELEATALETFDAFADSLVPLPDVVVCAVGLLGDQTADQRDVAAECRVMQVNYVGPACLLGVFAERFEKRGRGTIVGIGSVAGDRGRAKNYIYGSAKAGFAAYLSGLRNRLCSKGIQVLTVKPGFVATRMTSGMDMPSALTQRPEALAQRIVKAQRSGKDVIYGDMWWALIMAVIRGLPEKVFKRLDI